MILPDAPGAGSSGLFLSSTPEESTILQLLGYLLRIWLRRAAGKAEVFRSLPPILPIIVYHGAREWTVPLSLRDMVAAPEVIKTFQPEFRYMLMDLGPIPDPELSAYPPLRAGLLVLKYSHRDCDPEALLVQAFTDAKDLPTLMAMLTVYVTTVYSNVDTTLLRRAIRKVRPELEDDMVSLAAKEWKAEGRAEGEVEFVLHRLRRRFGDLSPEIDARVRSASREQFDEWMDRLEGARDLADVFGSDTKH